MTSTIPRRVPINWMSLSVAVLMTAIVLASVFFDLRHASPGPLGAVHEQVPELRGTRHCAACHGSAQQTMSEACLECHGAIADQLAAASGLHGRLDVSLKDRCERCHSEHHGPAFMLTNVRSFRLAGIADPKNYRHEGLDFRLTGKHLQLGCPACHAHAEAAVLAKGQHRFIGLEQTCVTCHDDVHHGNYGLDCERCHGQAKPFPVVAAFQHTPQFELVGAHGGLACRQCHSDQSPPTVLTLMSRIDLGEPLAVRRCGDCHASPHQPFFLEASARTLRVEKEQSCDACHPAADGSFSGPGVTMSRSWHALTGFPLLAPHDQVSCEACHPGFGHPKDSDKAFHQAYPGRHADDCRACHGDPHLGQFETPDGRPQDCLDCHQRTAFAPSLFTKTSHQSTQFPLAGAHQNAECRSCHPVSSAIASLSDTGQSESGRSRIPAGLFWTSIETEAVASKPLPRLFRGTPRQCNVCHEDPHAGQFSEGPFRNQDCDACHDVHSFDRLSFTTAQHNQTAFPLTGSHLAVACTTCHGGEGNREQRIKDGYRGTPTQCRACHDDVHNRFFEQRRFPAEYEGRRGCARCHTTHRFDEIVSDFDHGLWTGYPLRGAHRQADCAACHRDRAPVTREIRNLGLAPGRACAACHGDPHVGQFGPSLQVDCGRCHDETHRFSDIHFDHNRDCRFALDQDHVSLACSACHLPQRLPDGRFAIRYRPLGTDCGDCHVPLGPRQSTPEVLR